MTTEMFDQYGEHEMDFKADREREKRGVRLCDNCGQETPEEDTLRGLCPECSPRCQANHCNGLLIIQDCTEAICDQCGSIHVLKTEWILKEDL